MSAYIQSFLADNSVPQAQEMDLTELRDLASMELGNRRKKTKKETSGNLENVSRVLSCD